MARVGGLTLIAMGWSSWVPWLTSLLGEQDGEGDKHVQEAKRMPRPIPECIEKWALPMNYKVSLFPQSHSGTWPALSNPAIELYSAVD